MRSTHVSSVIRGVQRFAQYIGITRLTTGWSSCSSRRSHVAFFSLAVHWRTETPQISLSCFCTWTALTRRFRKTVGTIYGSSRTDVNLILPVPDFLVADERNQSLDNVDTFCKSLHDSCGDAGQIIADNDKL